MTLLAAGLILTAVLILVLVALSDHDADLMVPGWAGRDRSTHSRKDRQ